MRQLQFGVVFGASEVPTVPPAVVEVFRSQETYLAVLVSQYLGPDW